MFDFVNFVNRCKIFNIQRIAVFLDVSYKSIVLILVKKLDNPGIDFATSFISQRGIISVDGFPTEIVSDATLGSEVYQKLDHRRTQILTRPMQSRLPLIVAVLN